MAYENVLLVEGRNDAHAIMHLLIKARNATSNKKNSPDNILRVEVNNLLLAIKHLGGVENITAQRDESHEIERRLESLGTEIDASGLKRIGVVLDADDNPAGRWESVRNILHNVTQNSERKNVYSSLPLNPNPSGTMIVEPDKPRVGVWLMPDNSLKGNLEHFLDQLIPAHDSLGVLAEKCVGEAEAAAVQAGKGDQFPDPKKARVYTWLAWQEKPGSQFGVALSKGYFEAGLPLAQQFVTWLGQVFEF